MGKLIEIGFRDIQTKADILKSNRNLFLKKGNKTILNQIIPNVLFSQTHQIMNQLTSINIGESFDNNLEGLIEVEVKNGLSFVNGTNNKK